MKQQDGDDLGMWSEFGTAAGLAADRVARTLAGELSGGRAGGTAHSGMGDRPDLDGLPPVARMGDAPAPGEQVAGVVRDVAGMMPPEGYRNRVDADGDGTLDKATYRGDGKGGAEIHVDFNRDGRTDFIGYDTDLDNRVDFADYDKNRDGVFEKRMYDDDGDGYLDRSEWTAGS